MAENLNYSQIINNVISNFNSIYVALANKKVVNGAAVLDAAVTNGRGVEVSKYAGFITDQLFRVEGVESSTGVTLKNGVIAYANRGTTPVSAEATINGTNIAITIPASGYYDVTGGKLSVSLEGAAQTVRLTGVLSTNDNVAAGEDAYTVTATEGKILTDVIVDKGEVKVTLGDAQVDNKFTASVASTLMPGTVDASESAISGGYEIKIQNTPSYAGTLAITPTLSKKEGYVTASEISVDTHTVTVTKAESTASTKSIFLPKAAVTGISGTGEIELEPASGLAVVGENDNGYAITASGTLNISNTAQVTAGYLPTGELTVELGDANIADSTVYIKRGNVGTTAGNVVDVALKATPDYSAVNSDGNYEIAISIDKKTDVINIESGYIEATEVGYTLDGELTVEVPKGSAVVNVVEATLSETGATNKITTTNPGNAYAIEVVADAAVTKGTVTAGYVKNSEDLTISGDAATKKTYYVQKGAVSTQVELSATLVDTEDGKTDASTSEGSKVNIFSSTQPASGDYYEVHASSSTKGFLEGYIDAPTVDSAAANKTLYVPKAVFNYVKDVNGGNFLEVKTGGYIPSGAITDIAEITGTIDKAAVPVTLAGEGAVIKTSGSDNDYEITVGKGTVDAGYISQTDGTLSLAETYYVAHGGILLQNAISKLEKSAVVATVGDDGKVTGYKVTVTAAATTTPTLTPGYIKADDITGTAVVEDTLDIPFAKAGLVADSTDTAAIAPTADSGSVKLVDSSAYTINLGLSDDKITAKADTAGYLAAGDTQQMTVPYAEKTVYVQSGTKLTGVANTTADTRTSLSHAENGNTLVVSLESYDINVSGTLTEGYYAGENKTVTGKATVAAKSYTVEAATATATATGLAALAANEVVLVDANHKNENLEYYELTASASGNITTQVTGAGYLKDRSQIAAGDIQVTDGKYYVAKYVNTPKESAIVEGQEVHSVVVGANSGNDEYKGEQIATADKYVSNNIEVTLHADAMGSGVYTSLTQLEARLAGTL